MVTTKNRRFQDDIFDARAAEMVFDMTCVAAKRLQAVSARRAARSRNCNGAVSSHRAYIGRYSIFHAALP